MSGGLEAKNHEQNSRKLIEKRATTHRKGNQQVGEFEMNCTKKCLGNARGTHKEMRGVPLEHAHEDT